LNQREIQILEAFYHFPFLTAEQVIALDIYGPGSYQKVRANLKAFVDLNYLLRDTPLSDKPAGGVAYVYWLATRGRTYLEKEQGLDFSGWRFPSDMGEFVKSSHLRHCLGVTDFLLCAKRLPSVHPAIKIKTVLHDLTLKRVMQGAPVIPDGLIKFGSGQEPALWLEYDRKTEKEEAFKDKIKRIATFMDQGFADWFDTPVEQFLFAFVTPFGQERATQMRQWCEQELTRLHQTHKAPIMFFAPLPEQLDPAVVFLSRLWEAACEGGKHRLFELSAQ
jgi:hypothetical protein